MKGIIRGRIKRGRGDANNSQYLDSVLVEWKY